MCGAAGQLEKESNGSLRVSPAPAWGEKGTMYVNKYQQEAMVTAARAFREGGGWWHSQCLLGAHCTLPAALMGHTC